jgi:hypothetical protein
MNHQRMLIYLVAAAAIIIPFYSIDENVLGQEQQPVNNIDNLTDNLETMIEQNKRIIQQNDETALQEQAGAYIGTIALLVSLSVVIYGFKLSREGKTTQKAKRHYHIIILSLIVPVFILITISWFVTEEFLYPHYNIMGSLMLIPAILVIVLMFKGSIIGD